MYCSARPLSWGAQARALSINWQKLRNACLTPLTTSSWPKVKVKGRVHDARRRMSDSSNQTIKNTNKLHTDGLLHGKEAPASLHTASNNIASPKMWNKYLYHTARSLCRQEMSTSLSGWELDGAKWIRRDTSPERSSQPVCVTGMIFFFFKFQTSLRLHYMQGKAGGLVESWHGSLLSWIPVRHWGVVIEGYICPLILSLNNK